MELQRQQENNEAEEAEKREEQEMEGVRSCLEAAEVKVMALQQDVGELQMQNEMLDNQAIDSNNMAIDLNNEVMRLGRELATSRQNEQRLLRTLEAGQ